MKGRAVSLFDDQRMTLQGAIELSLASLQEYGRRYRTWVIAYSGGKDSSATATFVAWAIKGGQVPAPDNLIILYADTRQEYPPLYSTAGRLLDAFRQDGFSAEIVTPPLDDRFYVYLLGLGVPPPSNTFRWCTDKLKISPMTAALEERRQAAGEKFLLINGVRLGESAARDQRIALSCGKKGECGQGWFEARPPDSAGDSLAPLLHWRVCHVFDWLYFENGRHGYSQVVDIADVYGDEDVRTGCIGCNLTSDDPALKNLIRKPLWTHLAPLLELKPLFRELKQPQWRLRKVDPEKRKDGKWATNSQRMGPLTMDGRAYGLDKVLDIQRRAQVDLINAEEEARIRELWAGNAWPNRWSGEETVADVPVDQVFVIGKKTKIDKKSGKKINLGGTDVVTQPLLVR